jgi:hypothetical protein
VVVEKPGKEKWTIGKAIAASALRFGEAGKDVTCAT